MPPARSTVLLFVILSGVVASSALAAPPILQAGARLVDPPAVHDPRRIAVSPDGAHLYLRAFADQTLTVLARAAAPGTVARLAVYQDGVGGIDGLEWSGAVVVSPDGANVYTTSVAGDAVSVFTRDAATGLLTQTAVFRDGVGGIDGLAQANDLAIAPDGSSVYVTAAVDEAVTVFARDAGTGALTLVETIRDGAGGLESLRGVVVSPDGLHVYVVGDNTVVYVRDAVTGALTLASTLGTGGDQVLVPASGSHLYVYSTAGFGDGSIIVMARNATTGALAVTATLPQGNQSGATNPIALSPDDAFLYAGRRGARQIVTYARNPTTGALTAVDTVAVLPAGSGNFATAPTMPVVAPDGAHLYVLASVGDGLLAFERDTTTGLLTSVDADPSSLVAGDGLDGVRGVALDPDGDHVYAASERDDAVVVYDRDPVTGDLTWLQAISGGTVGMPRFLGLGAVVVAPDGRHVYVGGVDAVARFERDPSTGLLTYLGTLTLGAAAGALCDLVMDPTGVSIYTGCGDTLARDPIDGALTIVEDSFLAVNDVTISGDGRFVYTLRFDTIFVWSRNPVTGALTLVESIVESEVPLDTTSDVTFLVSPDDRFLFTAGRYLSVFERDPSTGRLRFRGQQSGPAAVGTAAITPDGAYLLPVRDLGVDVWAANPTNGALLPVSTLPEEDLATFTPQRIDTLSVSGDARVAYYAHGRDSTLGRIDIDPCGPVVVKSSFAATKTIADPTPGNDTLSIKGAFVLRGAPFASLDLVATGARVRVDAANGTSRADVTLPPGAYAGNGTRGWEQKGRTWLYRDRTGALLNGIGSVKLVEGANTAAGTVAVTLKAKNGSYPLLAGDAAPVVVVTIGAPEQCGRTIFDADDCTTGTTSMKCRPR